MFSQMQEPSIGSAGIRFAEMARELSGETQSRVMNPMWIHDPGNSRRMLTQHPDARR
jgi:hypothetical protein